MALNRIVEALYLAYILYYTRFSQLGNWDGELQNLVTNKLPLIIMSWFVILSELSHFRKILFLQ